MGSRVSRQPYRNGERYSLDGEWVRHRVTTVCRTLDSGDGLRNWFALQGAQWVLDHPEEAALLSPDDFRRAAHRAPAEARDAAAAKGTSLHEVFELLGDPDRQVQVPDELRSRAMLLAEFYDRHDVDVLAAEAIVFHDSLRYAGTLDCVVELTIDGQRRVWLLDLKTGHYYREACLQLAAYRHATHIQLDGEDVPVSALGIVGAGIVQLTANDWRLVPANSGAMPWEAFKHLLAVRDQFVLAHEDDLFKPALPKPELVQP